MSVVHRALAAACAAALCVAALAGCSGESQGTATDLGSVAAVDPPTDGGDSVADAGDGSDVADVADQDPGTDPEQDSDEGTVTVEVSSGPHAGTHTRSGNLQCAAIGDGRWVMFAPDEGAADEIAHLGVYWISTGIDRTVVDTPYPDTTQLLELKFGSVLATGEDAISINQEVGGSVDIAPPTFDEVGRPVYHFTATTADGVDLAISAAPTGCPPY